MPPEESRTRRPARSCGVRRVPTVIQTGLAWMPASVLVVVVGIGGCGSGMTAGSGTGTGGTGATGTGGTTGSGGTGATGTGVTTGTGGVTATGGNGTGGTGIGAGGAAGSIGPPGRPGVVVVDNAAHLTQCFPLCVVSTVPTSPAAPDWAYENGASCVLPGTATGRNQTCTTGQPIPPPESRPGVVVLDNATSTRQCVPLCVVSTVPNVPTAPDWAYENNSSCILPNTVTGKNQPCTTGQPVPALAPRPGILLVTSGADSNCVALCVLSKVPSDAAAPDWAYENNAACVLPASPTAAGRRTCTALGPPPSFVPPHLTGTKVRPGFYTSAGRLYDPYGQEFVIRGVNSPNLWFDTGANYLAYGALDNLAAYGTNTIRVVWDTTTLAGAPAVAVPAPASLLAEDLFRVVELKMVPIVEIHGTTGLTDPASLMAAAQYYVRPEVKQVLLNFQEYLLINIGNEWNGTTTYVSAYTAAINLLRTNGINHTLVIDANGSGQIVQSAATRAADEATWFTNAAALLQADPQHNLLFSVHMYQSYTSLANVTDVLAHAGVGTTLPLVVGEFGFSQGGIAVDWQDIMAQCVQRNLGYIAWSWFGNTGNVVQLNLAQAWEGPLSTWGSQVLTLGPNSIQATSHRASIFP